MSAHRVTAPLRRFAENRYVNLISGLILLATAGTEVVRTLEEGALGAHHGVALFGLLQVLKSLPHAVHGAEEISRFGR